MVCSDTDWAGCVRTRQSTSDGCIMIGSHVTKFWSSTQASLALSSGEAELTAVVKCSCECIGMVQLAEDWGLSVEADVLVDSTAALGVVNRKGAGRLRHVRVGKPWIQQVQEDGDLRYREVKGTQNPADMITKYLSSSEINKYLEMLGIDTRTGRADSSLETAL